MDLFFLFREFFIPAHSTIRTHADPFSSPSPLSCVSFGLCKKENPFRNLQGILNVLSKDLFLHIAHTNFKETREALEVFNGSVTQLTIAVNGRQAFSSGLAFLRKLGRRGWVQQRFACKTSILLDIPHLIHWDRSSLRHFLFHKRPILVNRIPLGFDSSGKD
jgi:hypothetical protein